MYVRHCLILLRETKFLRRHADQLRRRHYVPPMETEVGDVSDTVVNTCHRVLMNVLHS